MKISQELFNNLKEIYLTVRQEGFIAYTKQQELFFVQNFIENPTDPGFESIAMLYDYMEINADKIYYSFYKKHPEAKHNALMGEEGYTRACIKKYYNDIHYSIDDLLVEIQEPINQQYV